MSGHLGRHRGDDCVDGGYLLLPDALAAAIQIAKKRGITPENKVQLVHGIGCVVAVLREVAGELERRMREFEAEES